MLTLLLIVFIIAFVVLVISAFKASKKGVDWFGYGIIAFFVAFAIFMIAGNWFSYFADVWTESSIDQTIEMCQEENDSLEESIDLLVKNSMYYEESVLKDLKPESYITLLYKYPELESIPLLKQQIDLYTSNTNEIKNLKLQKISLARKKFWLYFGK